MNPNNPPNSMNNTNFIPNPNAQFGQFQMPINRNMPMNYPYNTVPMMFPPNVYPFPNTMQPGMPPQFMTNTPHPPQPANYGIPNTGFTAHNSFSHQVKAMTNPLDSLFGSNKQQQTLHANPVNNNITPSLISPTPIAPIQPTKPATSVNLLEDFLDPVPTPSSVINPTSSVTISSPVLAPSVSPSSSVLAPINIPIATSPQNVTQLNSSLPTSKNLQNSESFGDFTGGETFPSEFSSKTAIEPTQTPVASQVHPVSVTQPTIQPPNLLNTTPVEKSLSSSLPESNEKVSVPTNSNSDSSVSQTNKSSSATAPQKKKFDWSDTSKYQSIFSDLATPTPVVQPAPLPQPSLNNSSAPPSASVTEDWTFVETKSDNFDDFATPTTSNESFSLPLSSSTPINPLNIVNTFPVSIPSYNPTIISPSPLNVTVTETMSQTPNFNQISPLVPSTTLLSPQPILNNDSSFLLPSKNQEVSPIVNSANDSSFGEFTSTGNDSFHQEVQTEKQNGHFVDVPLISQTPPKEINNLVLPTPSNQVSLDSSLNLSTPTVIATSDIPVASSAKKEEDDFGDFTEPTSDSSFSDFVVETKSLTEDLITQERFEEARVCEEHINAEKEAKDLQIQYDGAVSMNKRMEALDIRDKLERTKIRIQPKEVLAKWYSPSNETTSDQMATRIKDRAGDEKARSFLQQYGHIQLVNAAKVSIASAISLKKQAKVFMDESTKTQSTTNNQFQSFIKPQNVKYWGIVLEKCWAEIENANEILTEVCNQDEWIKERFFNSPKFKYFLKGFFEIYLVTLRVKAVVNKFPQMLKLGDSAVSTLFTIDKIDNAWGSIVARLTDNQIQVNIKKEEMMIKLPTVATRGIPSTTWDDPTKCCFLCFNNLSNEEATPVGSNFFHSACANFFSHYFGPK